MDLVLATRSTHKIGEIRRILEVVPDLRMLDLTEAGIPYDPAEEDLEPYDTFEENAVSKASYFQGISGLPTVADDSGIEIDLLGGAPGARSKRFAPDRGLADLALDRANNQHLLASLGDAPLAERTGRYVCVAVLNRGDLDDVTVVRGEAPGLILNAPRGSGGFGYDPLFLDEELGKTFAEIALVDKNARSHRGKAFRALAARLVSAPQRS
jgi:XTP/dITP diphosphohydrolase